MSRPSTSQIFWRSCAQCALERPPANVATSSTQAWRLAWWPKDALSASSSTARADGSPVFFCAQIWWRIPSGRFLRGTLRTPPPGYLTIKTSSVRKSRWVTWSPEKGWPTRRDGPMPLRAVHRDCLQPWNTAAEPPMLPGYLGFTAVHQTKIRQPRARAVSTKRSGQLGRHAYRGGK